jgi:hypothetical protein
MENYCITSLQSLAHWLGEQFNNGHLGKALSLVVGLLQLRTHLGRNQPKPQPLKIRHRRIARRNHRRD